MNLLKTMRFFLVLIAASAFFIVSCGDDGDNVNCNQLYAEIGVATGGLLSSDCEDRVAAYNELIILYGKGKNCAEIKEYTQDEGYDSVSEFIEELEENRDNEEAAC
jgi:hypothetical protein